MKGIVQQLAMLGGYLHAIFAPVKKFGYTLRRQDTSGPANDFCGFRSVPVRTSTSLSRAWASEDHWICAWHGTTCFASGFWIDVQGVTYIHTYHRSLPRNCSRGKRLMIPVISCGPITWSSYPLSTCSALSILSMSMQSIDASIA